MSKDTIGWIDSDRMKASIAALRALRKKPVTPPNAAAAVRTPSTNMDSLFVDEEVPPKTAANRSEMRPITDVSKRAYAEAYAVTALGPSDEVEDKELYLRETQDIQAFPQHTMTRTPVREPQRNAADAAPQEASNEDPLKAPVVAFDVKHRVTDSIELGEPAEGEEIHVDKSLAQALDLLKDASPTSFELGEDDDYYDISSAFTQEPTPINAPAAATPATEVTIAPPISASPEPAKRMRDTMEIDPFAALDEIDRLADERDDELDEFGIPLHAGRKDFATGAFDSVDKAAVLNWENQRRQADPFERLEGRISFTKDESIRRSLEAVTAETPTVAVDEDDTDVFPSSSPTLRSSSDHRVSLSSPVHESRHIPTANVPTLGDENDADSDTSETSRSITSSGDKANDPTNRVTAETPTFDPFANLDEELEAEAQAVKARSAGEELSTHQAPAFSALSENELPVSHEGAETEERSSLDLTAQDALQAEHSFEAASAFSSPIAESLDASHTSDALAGTEQDHPEQDLFDRNDEASVEHAFASNQLETGLPAELEAASSAEISSESFASSEGLDAFSDAVLGDFDVFDAGAEVLRSVDSANPFEAVSPEDISDVSADETQSSAFEAVKIPFEATSPDDSGERAESYSEANTVAIDPIEPSDTADAMDDDATTPIDASESAEKASEPLETITVELQSPIGEVRFLEPAPLSMDETSEPNIEAPSLETQSTQAAVTDTEHDLIQPWKSPPAATNSPNALHWLRQASNWIRSIDASYTVFVADADGLSLISEGVDEDTIALAVATRNAIVGTRQIPGERTEGQLSYTVSDSTFCHLMWKQSEFGVLTFGVLSDHALPASTFQDVQSEFAYAIDELPIG